MTHNNTPCGRCCDWGFELTYNKPPIDLVVVGHEETTTEKGFGNLTALDGDGNILWTVHTGYDPDFSNQVRRPATIVIDNDTNIIVQCNAERVSSRNNKHTAYIRLTIVKFRNNGDLIWEYEDEIVSARTEFALGFNPAFGGLAVDSKEKIWFIRNGLGEQQLVYVLNKDGELIDSIGTPRISDLVGGDGRAVSNSIEINNRDEVMLYIVEGVGGFIDSSFSNGPVIFDENKNRLWALAEVEDDMNLSINHNGATFQTDDLLYLYGTCPNPFEFILADIIPWSANLTYPFTPANISFTTFEGHTEWLTPSEGFDVFFIDVGLSTTYIRAQPFSSKFDFDNPQYNYGPIWYDGSLYGPQREEDRGAPNANHHAFTARRDSSAFYAVRNRQVSPGSIGEIKILTNTKWTTSTLGVLDPVIHNMQEGSPFKLFGDTTTYYVRNPSFSEFELSLTPDGPIIDTWDPTMFLPISAGTVTENYLVTKYNPDTTAPIWRKPISLTNATGYCITARNFGS